MESSKALGPWRERVALAAYGAMGGRPILSGVPLHARYDFVMPRPASTPKRLTPPAIKRPDGDKLERAINDALTGVVFADDSALVSWCGSKRLAEIDETPGVFIEILLAQPDAVPVVPNPTPVVT